MLIPVQITIFAYLFSVYKFMAFIRQYWYHLLAVITVIIWGTTFVSTKVLINEGLGAVGNKEAIAAYAIASLIRKD